MSPLSAYRAERLAGLRFDERRGGSDDSVTAAVAVRVGSVGLATTLGATDAATALPPAWGEGLGEARSGSSSIGVAAGADAAGLAGTGERRSP